MSRENLSVAEYTILGIVWRDGPCTTYVVMRTLAKSASSFYRNRASSTYRVVQRLIGLGLLEPAGEEAGSRGEREVGITSSGIAALRKWLTPPIPSVEVAHTIDLLRLRMFFLDILDAATREGFIDDTLAKLKEHVLELEMQAAKTGSPFSKLGVLGAVYETKARIEWLEHVKTKLPELQRSEPD